MLAGCQCAVFQRMIAFGSQTDYAAALHQLHHLTHEQVFICLLLTTFLRHCITPFAAHTEHFPFLQKTITIIIFSSNSSPKTDHQRKLSSKKRYTKNDRSDHLHIIQCVYINQLMSFFILVTFINNILHFR